jgi:hypothetical protein
MITMTQSTCGIFKNPFIYSGRAAGLRAHVRTSGYSPRNANHSTTTFNVRKDMNNEEENMGRKPV